MSDTKFTPGPWELWPLEDSVSVRIFAGTHYVGSIGNSDDEPSQTRANGHLIAAAPDMYEALKKVFALLFDETHPDIVISRNDLRDLISKAEGEV